MDLKPSEDSELLFRILLAGPELVHVPDTLVLYRLHQSNQISGSALGSTARSLDWLRYTRRIMNWIDRNPDRFSRLDRLTWLSEVAFARRQAIQLGNNGVDKDQASLGFELASDVLATIRTLRRGLERRLLGSEYSSFYQTGPLRPSQDILLRQIGYQAQHVSYVGKGHHL
jgi:hypothetical protein